MKTRNYLKYLKPAIHASIVLMVLMYSCINDHAHSSDEEAQDTGTQNAVRKKIQLFWDNYREAQKYKAEGNWEKAAKYYSEALEIDPSHEDALFNLGNMYLEMRDYFRAKLCWQNIINTNPNSARAHMQLGRLYLSPERPEVFNLDSAKLELTLTLEINRIITGPIMLLGQIALIEGDFPKADEYFSAVIGSNVKNVEAYYLLGYLAWKNGNMEQCDFFLGEAIKNRQPDKSEVKELSEGDTKDGVSYLRPINVSLFSPYIKVLGQIESVDREELDFLEQEYKPLDSFLARLRAMSR